MDQQRTSAPAAAKLSLTSSASGKHPVWNAAANGADCTKGRYGLMLSQSDGKGRWLYWGLLTHGSRRRFTDMGRAEMTDLEHFELWANKTGAYQTVEAIARYRQYLENKRANEADALRERVNDND